MSDINHITPENKNTEIPPLHRGDLIISAPMLGDPNFNRTVVLIIDQDKDHGYIGLTLNRPTDLHLSDIFDNEEKSDGNDFIVFNGGPVDLQRLFWIHRLGDKFPGSIEILPGIFVGGRLEDVNDYLHSGESADNSIRFYLGYSGWAKGQLEKEIEMGAWQVQRIADPADILTADQESLWRKEVRDLGPEFRHWLMLPPHPSMN